MVGVESYGDELPVMSDDGGDGGDVLWASCSEGDEDELRMTVDGNGEAYCDAPSTSDWGLFCMTLHVAN